MKKDSNLDSTVQPVEMPVESTQVPQQNVVMDQQPVQAQPVQAQPVNVVPQAAVNPVRPSGIGAIIKKYLVLIIIAGVVLLAIIGVGGYSVATSTPKSVFKSQVNNMFKLFDNTVDDYDDFQDKFDTANNGLLLKGSVKIDSNISDIDNADLLKKLTISGEAGIDVKNEKLYVAANAKGDKETLGIKAYYQDDATYIDASFLNEIVKVEDGSSVDFDELQEAIDSINEQLEKSDAKTYKAISKAIRDAINKSLNSKNMRKTNAKFEVDGKSVSATKNSLVLDEDTLEDMITNICEELLKDDKFIENVANSFDVDKSDVRDLLKDLKEAAKDIDLDEDIVINVYTKGVFHTAVGFSIEVDEKEYVTFFTNGKKAEFTIDNHEKGAYKEKFVVSFEQTKEGTEFTAKYNSTKVATGTIREMSDKLIDFDITLYSGSENIKVSVYLSKKEEKKSISGEYKVKVTIDKEYIEVSGTYGLEIGDIPSANTKNAVSSDDLDEEELIEKAVEFVEKDSVLDAIFSDGIKEAQEDALDLNYYGMKDYYNVNEVKKLLTKNKATVLYIGDSYYYSYSEEAAHNLLSALKTAQDDLDFYSHHLDDYYMTLDFEEELKSASANATVTCEVISSGYYYGSGDDSSTTATCSNYPAIYLIKDGEVKQVIKGNINSTKLESILKEFGI